VEPSGDLLLNLYRAARTLPVDAFQEEAVQLVKPLLRFDLAMWGAGRMTHPGVTVHTLFLHEIPGEHIAEWQSLNTQDKVIPLVSAQPGKPLTFHSPTLFAGDEDRPMREFTERAGWQSAMVTAFVDPQPRVMQWLSLFRRDADHAYTDGEQSFASLIVPHFVEALTINRTLHMLSVYGPGADRPGHFAYADSNGFLYYADPGFTVLLTGEFPAWDGRTVPQPWLDDVVVRGKTLCLGRSMSLDARVQGGLVFLRAHALSRIDELSPRERDVAARFARGHSHKDIARDLELSPSTVRHHLKSIYAKLAIHDKAELARLFR
jgi:DNA-binding CsgD family transcriptional regulator